MSRATQNWLYELEMVKSQTKALEHSEVDAVLEFYATFQKCLEVEFLGIFFYQKRNIVHDEQNICKSQLSLMIETRSKFFFFHKRH